jgi:hypothetical protein
MSPAVALLPGVAAPFWVTAARPAAGTIVRTAVQTTLKRIRFIGSSPERSALLLKPDLSSHVSDSQGFEAAATPTVIVAINLPAC